MAFILADAELPRLLDLLREGGRRLLGPVLRDGAAMFGPVEGLDDLARGMVDESEAGQYRLHPSPEGAWFDLLLGPDSAKRALYPARQTLFRSRPSDQGFTVEPPPPPPPLAIFGLRACDLAAIRIQDRVLLRGQHADPHYASRRSDLLLVAVQCRRATSTCFCASMGSGPRLDQGFDLALTEITGGEHRFVVEAGSPAGEALLARLQLAPADAEEACAPAAAAARAEAMMSRRLPTAGLRERMIEALDGPGWKEVADRCLACGNCTMVCPTCFCTQVTDLTDLDDTAERVRTWDSCFTSGHSYVHGGPVHPTTASRYRQWISHKLSTWWEQFGTSGCVGCGRCITWCPPGIDIVAEAMRLAGPAPSSEAETP